MLKRILLLEDEPGVRLRIEDHLCDSGYDVIGFRRIDQANEYFSEHSDEIDCMVVDLNMADHWLGSYRHESDGGVLAGWVFMRRFVYPIKPNMPTVLYSGLIEDYEKEIRNEMPMARIECVSKGDDNSIKSLFDAIKRVTQQGGIK